MEVFQIILGIDFLWIWQRFLLQVGSRYAPKIDIKRVLKNDEKMMITRMANKLHVGGYDCARNGRSRALGRRKGGGINPSSRELEEMGLNGCWDEDFTKVLDHLSPKAGGILWIP